VKYNQRRLIARFKLPPWFDPSIAPLIYQKQQTLYQERTRLIYFITLLLFHTQYKSWEIVEQMIESIKIVDEPTRRRMEKEETYADRKLFNIIDHPRNIGEDHYGNAFPEFDIIIGIKSGGAFLAKYVQLYMNIPYLYYVKVSVYAGLSPLNFIKCCKKNINQLLKKKNYDYICPHTLDGFDNDELVCKVKQARILVVDDAVGVGATMIIAKKKLYEMGAAEVKSFVIYTGNPDFSDYYYSKKINIHWPWGLESS
jgi:hypoxanthine phosphoribosyltransferase